MDKNPHQKDRDHDTDGSDFDSNFQLEPLPRAADIIAELPDYPDSEEEEEVRSIMQMISVSKPDEPESDETPLENVQECNDKRTENVEQDKIPPDKVQCSDKPAPENTDDITEQIDAIDVDVDIKNDERNVVTENTAKRLAPSPIVSPVKSKKEISPPQERLSTSPLRQSKRQRIEGPKNVVVAFEPKVWINKAGEFVTGFDPLSAEAKYRRQLRMKRFGKHEKVEKSKMDDTIIAEDDSIEVEKEVTYEKRPEAIHLFGTDDLSTDDILEYFAEFSPHRIEWLDDSHCNVVWSDVHSAKRALLTMSYRFTSEDLEEKKAELRRKEKDEDEFYLLPGTLDRPQSDDYKGVWRVATKDNPKAHLMFMRFANTGDLKKRGAHLTSRYYSLYGNPNAPFIKTNNYTAIKQRQMQESQMREEKRTNQEVTVKNKLKKDPDLRRYLNKGQIDVDQIKEEYKLGKPLIETLTIEVDRSEKTNDIEVRKDDESEESSTESESSAPPTPVKEAPKKKKTKKKVVEAVSSSSSSSSSSDSSGSSSSSSSGSSSDEDSSSSSDSSEQRSVQIQRKKKVLKRPVTAIIRKPLKPQKVAKKAAPKLSSQIQKTQNNGVRRKVPNSFIHLKPGHDMKRPEPVRVKRRGRSPPGSPHKIVKKSRTLPRDDLRSKLAARSSRSRA